MVRSQIWTTRLHEQSGSLSSSLSRKESIIRTLLNWIDEPPTDHKAVYELFKIEGNGLVLTLQMKLTFLIKLTGL